MYHDPEPDAATVLRIGGAVAAVGAGAGTIAATNSDVSLSGLQASNTLQRAGWETAETPTGNTLHDVEYTTGGAYAVGGGGIVLERASEGWTKVLDGGPITATTSTAQTRPSRTAKPAPGTR